MAPHDRTEPAGRAAPASPAKAITVALAGNPNSGKTTVFNALTGAHQRVGNYPGVTVEKKTGRFEHDGVRVEVVDLPGTYSLTAYSLDERVARNFVVDERPDMVVDVIDSSNLERNLYLALQFIELGVPVLLCLNMTDELHTGGRRVDLEKFIRLTGCPAVQTVGHKREGIRQLRDAIVDLHEHPDRFTGLSIDYGGDLEPQIQRIAEAIDSLDKPAGDLDTRWLALKLLERDPEIEAEIAVADDGGAVRRVVTEAADKVLAQTGDRSDVLIPERRYGYLAGLYRETVQTTVRGRQNVSDKLDNVLTHRLLGPLVLLAVLFGLYQLTVWASAGPVDWTAKAFGALGLWVDSLFASDAGGGSAMLRSLLVDGIIGGLGGILSFMPLIVLLFVAITIVEDSGYMARIAFIMDRVLHWFGLHGKSVLALVVSGGLPGGCAVPGVLATRVLRNRRDRLTTILVIPLLMCGPKVMVISMLCLAFFEHQPALMMFVYTLITWAVVMLAAVLLKATVLRGRREPFVIELPPYRLPRLGAVLRHTWQRTWMFLKKAGTVILAISIVLWALMSFPQLTPQQRDAAGGEAEAAALQLEHSFAGRFGRFLEPATALFGQNWKTNVALTGGIGGKEVVLTTLGTAYSIEHADEQEDHLARRLAGRLAAEPDWTALSAFTLGLFVLFYAPCLPTVVAIGKEAGWRWAGFSILYTTALAYILAVAVFQGGRLLRFG